MVVTRQQEVIEQIRAMIIAGDLKPDSPVRTKHLAEKLNVSRTPIRDALSVLADQGLLIYKPNYGYRVRLFTFQDMLDTFEVRAELEAMACRINVEQGEWGKILPDLERNLEQSHNALYGNTWNHVSLRSWHELNLEFHNLLVDNVGNRVLIDMIKRCRQMPLTFTTQQIPKTRDQIRHLFTLEQSQQAFAEHTKLVEAIRGGMAMRASHIMAEHVLTNRDILRSNASRLWKEEGGLNAAGNYLTL